MSLILIFGIVFFFFIIGLSINNGLIAKRNQVTNAFSSIDVMLKKRFDLLPNLVEVVKQYAKHEESVLTKVSALRAGTASGPLSDIDKINLDKQVSSAINGMMITAERYPELKADSHFMNLETTWIESEEQISAARRNYNSSVTAFNNAIMMFPGSMFAGRLKYVPLPVMETPVEERKNISAKDLFNN